MDIGKPLLPVKNVLFALPPSAKVISVDFQFDKLTQLPGFYNIEPAPIIFPIDEKENATLQKFGEVYNLYNGCKLNGGMVHDQFNYILGEIFYMQAKEAMKNINNK